jgi:hypothetical protein
MKIYSLLLLLFFCTGCKKGHSRSEILQELSNAMLTRLWTEHNKDTSSIKFQILDVNYFEDRTFFECQFKVHMYVLSTGFDTVGMMAARVSKDFSTVKRKL